MGNVKVRQANQMPNRNVIERRKFAIYARKSKYTGKGESVENQDTMGEEYILQHYAGTGEEDIVLFEDEGYSGGNLIRPQFIEMMERTRAGEFKAIIVYRLDRISRNIGDFAKLIDELAYLEVDFISIREQFDTSTPMGKAMMYIASVFSQLERETTAERIRDNLHELAKTGRWLGGTTPTGFASECVEHVTIDGKVRTCCKLKEIQGELEIVDLIFDRMEADESLTKTDTYLLKNHCKTKNGNHFSRFAIKNILMNPVYVKADEAAYDYFMASGAGVFAEKEQFDGVHGVMVYNRTAQTAHKAAKINPISEWIVSVGAHVGRIPGARWVHIQQLLEENKDRRAYRYRSGRGNEALLSGLLFCACGDYMRPKMQTRTLGDGARAFYYVCTTKERSRGGLCSAKPVNGNVLDKWVGSVIKEIACAENEWIEGMRRARTSLRDNRTKEEQELVNVRLALAEQERAIQGLVGVLTKASGTPAEDHIIKQIEDLDRQARSIRARLTELETRSEKSRITEQKFADMEDQLSNFAATIDSMPAAQKRAAIRAVVKRIVWDGTDIHLYLIGSDDSVGIDFPREVFPPLLAAKNGHDDRIAFSIQRLA